MKIVILDVHCENPGDLSWSVLEALGELTVYDSTPLDDEADIPCLPQKLHHHAAYLLGASRIQTAHHGHYGGKCPGIHRGQTRQCSEPVTTGFLFQSCLGDLYSFIRNTTSSGVSYIFSVSAKPQST